LPDFRVGYSNQSMIGWQDVGNTAQYFNAGDRFSGVKFGIDIPIWFKANTAKFQAETKAIYYETQLMGE
jgi:cobalt-zinc-cadmium resistance protein CzcA